MASRDKDADSLIMYDRIAAMADLRAGGDWFCHGDVGLHASRAAPGRTIPFLFAKRDAPLYLPGYFALAMVTLRLPMTFWQNTARRC